MFVTPEGDPVSGVISRLSRTCCRLSLRFGLTPRGYPSGGSKKPLEAIFGRRFPGKPADFPLIGPCRHLIGCLAHGKKGRKRGSEGRFWG